MAARSAPTLFVTGKGGAGKSSVAQALALEAARRGMRVGLVEALDGDQRRCAPSTVGGIDHLVLDPRHALRHLLARLLRFGFLSDRLMDSRTFSAVAAAAPGLYDLVRLDYLRELAEGRARASFDLLVIDAPASGHGIGLLEAPHLVSELAAIGPARTVAHAARAFISQNPAFRAVVVALPEELSVAETAETHAALSRLHVSVTATVVNGVYPQRASEPQAAWLRRHEGSTDARLYLERRERQIDLADGIASPGGPRVVLPYAFAGEAIAASERSRLFEVLTRGLT
jgi:anion-transporting  ArsA/GET3 family ATPase